MRRLLLFLLFLGVAGNLAFSQNASYNTQILQSVNGFVKVVPGATITFCSTGSTGIPCTPALYTTLSDGNGNVNYVIPPGTYDITVTGIGITGYKIMNQTLAANSTQTICTGTISLPTSAISSGAKSSAITATCTGLATSDNIMLDFSSDPSGVTGYSPSANGTLTVVKFPTTNTINVWIYNDTASSVTPGAMTLNYRVVR